SLNQLPDYPITRLPDSPASYPSFVFLLEHVCNMQIERRRGSDIRAAEFGVAAIADRQIFQSTVDKQIDEHGAGENAVRQEIAAEPVEGAADKRANDDDGQSHLGIEIFSTVEVGAVTHR